MIEDMTVRNVADDSGTLYLQRQKV